LFFPPSSTTDLPAFCQDFFEQSTSSKIVILRQYGLERYSQLLVQMVASSGNLRCLVNFFGQPDRLKFPQLQGTELAGLDLQGTNLIRANFTDANLQGCCLRSADLMFGNFTRANLTHADLSSCTLYETCWQDSIVINCIFFDTKGITPSQQQSLLARGGHFS
jgi:uncharacterized protein YjbI with pentapeptide repeats